MQFKSKVTKKYERQEISILQKNKQQIYKTKGNKNKN